MKNLLDYLQGFFAPRVFTGLFPDNRSQKEKDQDIHHEEVAGGAATLWIDKPEATWRRFIHRDQAYSYSCVAQSAAKVFGIEDNRKSGTFEVYSAKPMYLHRSNYPSPGMIPTEALDNGIKLGLIYENLLPSEYLEEPAMNQDYLMSQDMYNVANKTKGKRKRIVLPIDIDAIASVIDQGKAVSLCFKFNYKEWSEHPIRKFLPLTIHHNIVAVDRTLYNGQKALICEDSAFLELGTDRRIITEDFLNNRCFAACYVIDLPPPIPTGTKPNHFFSVDIQLADKSNEVIALQDRLKFEGYFSPTIPSTGYFGSYTFQCVQSYQEAHHIPNTGYCGSLTRANLNAS